MEVAAAHEWVEVQASEPRDALYRIMDAVERIDASSVHHFIQEPWSPLVVRVCASPRDLHRLRELLDVGVVVPWSPDEDAAYYGAAWPAVRDFFAASSAVHLAAYRDGCALAPLHLHMKLVHCYLNTNGQGVRAEWLWAKAFLRNRRRQWSRDFRAWLRQR